MLKALAAAFLFAAFAPVACALEVAMSVDRSTGCDGSPPDDEWKRIEVKRLGASRLEVVAWDEEIGGCAIDPASAKAVLDGSRVLLSSARNCPGWSDPVPMCAAPVRVVYTLSGLPAGKVTVVLSGNNPGYVEVDG